jgi:hypothetical protein
VQVRSLALFTQRKIPPTDTQGRFDDKVKSSSNKSSVSDMLDFVWEYMKFSIEGMV